jgi:copper chaperone CopZ
MKSLSLIISGMTCNHCVMHVKKALASLDGIKIEDVQIGTASIVAEDSVSHQTLSQAIEKAGYRLDAIQ